MTFAERQANGAFREIGSAKGRRGTLVFTPSPTLGRSRTIEAMVTQDGHPREDAVIAHFKVASITLPAPKHLRLARRGGALRISFGPVAGARGYGLSVRLSDGRSLYLKLAPTGAHGDDPLGRLEHRRAGHASARSCPGSASNPAGRRRPG